MVKRILVLGNDRDLRDLLAMILADGGYAVDAVHCVDDALAAMCRVVPAVALVHSAFAPSSCRTFVAACRQGPVSAPIPIAVLADPTLVAGLADLPVDAFILIPFDLDDFLTVIGRLAEDRPVLPLLA
jgi:CheY-like chemotaxis protein